MLGAFLSVVFLGGVMGQTGGVTNVPFLVLLLLSALVFTMPIVALINVGIERVVYRPLRNAPKLAPLITAIGVSFILQNVALTVARSGDRAAPVFRSSGRSRSVGLRSRSCRSSSSPWRWC
jgi:branched-chain amino acid transport system permease protein